MTKPGSVRFVLDPAAPLSVAEREDLATLRASLDAPVDTSDIPPLGEGFWAAAERNPFYRPVKQQVTVRLDADVLAWLRAGGRGYQTKLNAVLRDAMLREAKRG